MNDMKKILVVEDEIPLLKALSMKLKKAGFLVLEAQDGQIGLDIALKEKPDLILSDILMPNMDGFTMVNNLRQDEWGKDALIIFLTNFNNPQDIDKALQSGIYDYLVKNDWNLNDLIGKIKEKLGLGEDGQEQTEEQSVTVQEQPAGASVEIVEPEAPSDTSQITQTTTTPNIPQTNTPTDTPQFSPNQQQQPPQNTTVNTQPQQPQDTLG